MTEKRIQDEYCKRRLKIAELATEYQVHPKQITLWEKLIQSEAPLLFSGKNIGLSFGTCLQMGRIQIHN